MNDKNVTSIPNESRFKVAPATLWADLWMGRLIRFGGVSVIAAVIGMLVFLVWQIFPLFSGAAVTPSGDVRVGAGAVAFGEDESGEVLYAASADGTIRFYRRSDSSQLQEWVPPAGHSAVTAVKIASRDGMVLLGHADGSVTAIQVGFKVNFDAQGSRSVEPVVKALPPRQVALTGRPVTEVWSVKNAGGTLFVARQTDGVGSVLTGLRVTERKGMGGRVVLSEGKSFRIAGDLAQPGKVIIPSTADSALILGPTGDVRVYSGAGEALDFIQSFRPFPDPGSVPTAAGMVFGEVSAVFIDAKGQMRIWSIHPIRQQDSTYKRLWGEVRDPVTLSGPGKGVWPAAGNKCFLAVHGDRMEIRNMTTDSTRWEGPAPSAPVTQVVFSRNYDRMALLCADGVVRRWSIEDHHPESSWRAFFGKIWYEGATQDEFVWQSSSGNDEFEAKYSLIPLIYGTIKGTFYALLFALPIALLAAVYVSQFLRPDLRLIVKPVMEIMASLPSVVLGFLAGLWLAPVVDANLVPILCVIASLAPAGLFAGFLWSSLPQPVRRQVKPGMEFLWIIPFLAVTGYAAWHAGPLVESGLFTVTDPSGAIVADFREWWRSNTGLAYDARNSLVVGFVMGFAVIPIVFTIAEDALSNVPVTLTSGSLALGASRWQTVWRVILPTAISGIVSAVMIGFGRAVGETMIVVMATGNTAVMESNPFNGMRTLSANIAVELPEAPVGHTHFRALFLGACCLFLLTFVVNTLAELLRQRLRERYKTV